MIKDVHTTTLNQITSGAITQLDTKVNNAITNFGKTNTNTNVTVSTGAIDTVPKTSITNQAEQDSDGLLGLSTTMLIIIGLGIVGFIILKKR